MKHRFRFEHFDTRSTRYELGKTILRKSREWKKDDSFTVNLYIDDHFIDLANEFRLIFTVFLAIFVIRDIPIYTYIYIYKDTRTRVHHFVHIIFLGIQRIIIKGIY